jgi:PAS domain S-box-containing protein
MRELRQAKIVFEAKRVDTRKTFLQALKDFEPDVILSDFSLPQFNALDALGLLKELNLDTPFILYTGSLTEEVAVKCMKEGAADYILKSSLTRLPSAVLNVLEKKEARRTKEEALAARRESEEWLKALLDASRDGIIVEDEGEIVYINRAYARQLKYDNAAELVGRHISEILPPDEAKRLSEFGQRRLRGEQVPSTYQFKGLCKDGTQVEVEGAVSICVIGGKKYIMTAVRDISERKLAAEALEKSERQYRFLGEGIMHQVWTAQPDGKIDYVNNRTLEYFGLTYERMINDGWQNVLHPDDLAGCVECWTKSLETGEHYGIEFRLKKADGTYRWHLARATAGRDAEGKIIKWYGTSTDIHDKKLAEEELT